MTTTEIIVFAILILLNIANLWNDWGRRKAVKNPPQKILIEYEVNTEKFKADLKKIEYEVMDFQKRTKIPLEIEVKNVGQPKNTDR